MAANHPDPRRRNRRRGSVTRSRRLIPPSNGDFSSQSNAGASGATVSGASAAYREDHSAASRAAAQIEVGSVPVGAQPDHASSSATPRRARRQRVSQGDARATSRVNKRYGSARGDFAADDASANRRSLPQNISRQALLKHYGLAALTVYGAIALAVVTLAVIGVTIAGGGIRPFPATVASIWLTLHAAPFKYSGTTVTMAPLLPALILVALVAWRIRREVGGRITIRQVRALALSYLVVPLVMMLIAWLMLWDASGQLKIGLPNFWLTMLTTVLVASSAIVIGMGGRLWRALLRWRGLPDWPVTAAKLAARFTVWLLALGLLLTLLALVAQLDDVLAAFEIANGPGATAALVGLCLLYLPNMAVFGAGVLCGIPVQFGAAEVSVFATVPGQLPPMPLLAALPQSELPVFAAGLLLIPASVAVWQTRNYLRDSVGYYAYREVVAAAFLTGVGFCVLGFLASGSVGVYGTSGVQAGLLGFVTSLWLALPGAAMVVALYGFGSRGRGVEAEVEAEVEAGVETAELVDENAAEETEAQAQAARRPVAQSAAQPTNQSGARTTATRPVEQEAEPEEAQSEEAETEAAEETGDETEGESEDAEDITADTSSEDNKTS